MPKAADRSGTAIPGPAPEAAILALLRADHADPFGLLGMHQAAPGGPVVVRAFLPGARAVHVVDTTTAPAVVTATLALVHGDGVFAGPVPGRTARFPYRLRVEFAEDTLEFEDAYRFPPVQGELDAHLLAEGSHLQAYEKLGAHLCEIDSIAGTAFAVWAPNASRVSVVGDFCDWDGRRLPMRKRLECGVWELFVPGVQAGARYKFELKAASGALLPLKSDPCGRAAEQPPRTASAM